MKHIKAIWLAIVAGLILTMTACGPSKAELEEKKTQEAFDTAAIAYSALCEAGDMTVGVMKSVYGAWYFGIYKAKDSLSVNVVANLANEVVLTKSELEAGVKSLTSKLSTDETTVKHAMCDGLGNITAWEFSLQVIYESYEANGSYDDIQSKIDAANAALKTMTNEFDGYKHYPTLKELYAKVSAYYEFTKNPTGSFQQLKDTMSSYENDIRTLKSDLSFVFD